MHAVGSEEYVKALEQLAKTKALLNGSMAAMIEVLSYHVAAAEAYKASLDEIIAALKKMRDEEPHIDEKSMPNLLAVVAPKSK